MSLYHIISISIRKAPGDRAYHVLESFKSDSDKSAHERHLACRIRCTVLRDGSTGRRYSVADSQHHIASFVERMERSCGCGETNHPDYIRLAGCCRACQRQMDLRQGGDGPGKG